jgi:hypothetical protein
MARRVEPALFVIAGLDRQSIFFEMMDARIKSAHDEEVRGVR